MLVCKKILIEKDEIDSIHSESVAIVALDENIGETEIGYIVSEAVENECKFIVIWSKESDKIEDKIDKIIEENGDFGITTTSHDDEEAVDVVEFAKNATFVDGKSFYCLIFSERNSIRIEKLMKYFHEQV